MKKRLTLAAWILIITFSLAVGLPGCGKADPDAISRVASDMGGYEFTWATLWEWNNYPEAGVSDYGDQRLEKYDRIQTDYNCTITAVPLNADSFFEKINSSVMAGDKYADFIEVDFMRYQVLNNNKALLPLNQIEGFDVAQEKFFSRFTTAYTDDAGSAYGVQYQLPDLISSGLGTMIFFNKTLLEKYNLESPYDLFKDDKWTFDKFAEMCRTLTKDLNGDNELDQWGMGTIDWHYNNFEKPMLFANNASIIEKNSENRWQFALMSSNAQSTLNFLAKLTLEDKVMSPQSFTSSPTDAVDHFTEGNVGFFFANPELIDRVNSSIADEWGMIILPKGPAATDYRQGECGIRSWVMLKNNEEDAKTAATIFDAISDPVTGSVSKDQDLYYDQFLNNMLNGDEDALDQIKMAAEKMVPDYSWGATAATNQLNTVFDASLRQGGMTVKAAMEAIAPVFQGYLEGFFYPVEETGSVAESTTTSAAASSN
ncbi:MAG: ABC transporter substrate-binding protein [Saccharofermentanales bacterium]